MRGDTLTIVEHVVGCNTRKSQPKSHREALCQIQHSEPSQLRKMKIQHIRTPWSSLDTHAQCTWKIKISCTKLDNHLNYLPLFISHGVRHHALSQQIAPVHKAQRALLLPQICRGSKLVLSRHSGRQCGSREPSKRRQALVRVCRIKLAAVLTHSH